MSRQLDNLRRIFGKLQARYGDDDIVSEFRSELESREGLESRSASATIDSRRATAAGPVSRRHGGRLAEAASDSGHAA